MRLRSAILFAIASTTIGCFVLDELDQGKAKAGAGGESPAGDDSEGPAFNPHEWWEKARSLDPADADPSIIRCDQGGSLSFMREEDCRARGGRPRRS